VAGFIIALKNLDWLCLICFVYNCQRMETLAGEKGQGFSSTSFRTLFSIAYSRIWSSRTLRGLDVIFWSVMAIYITAILNHFDSYMITRHLFAGSRLALGLLTPMLIGAWVYRIHASVGIADDSLRTVPEHPIRILWSRMLAVMVSWAQFSVPFFVVFLLESSRLFYWKSGTMSVVQLIGWALLCTTWGLLVGSRGAGKGSSFLIPYFVPGAVILVAAIILQIFNLSMRLVTHPMYLAIHETFLPHGESLPIWLQVVGLAGIPLSFILLLFASRRWIRRS
jgi:hypothetical protein